MIWMLISPKLTILNSNKRNRVSCQCHWHKLVLNWNEGMPLMDMRTGWTGILRSIISFRFQNQTSYVHHRHSNNSLRHRVSVSVRVRESEHRWIDSTHPRQNNKNGMLAYSPHLCTKSTYFLDINEFEWYALG